MWLDEETVSFNNCAIGSVVVLPHTYRSDFGIFAATLSSLVSVGTLCSLVNAQAKINTSALLYQLEHVMAMKHILSISQSDLLGKELVTGIIDVRLDHQFMSQHVISLPQRPPAVDKHIGGWLPFVGTVLVDMISFHSEHSVDEHKSQWHKYCGDEKSSPPKVLISIWIWIVLRPGFI